MTTGSPPERPLVVTPAPSVQAVPEPEPADVPGLIGTVAALVRVARPKQWLKNVLVFAAPAAAGDLGHGHVLGRSALAFLIFCAAASATYFVNDTVDAEADRHHPVKGLRPIASGLVKPAAALTMAGLLMAGALAGAWGLASGRLTLVVGLYLVLSTAYSLQLKHLPVVDLACLASGFILRAIAGGVATGVVLSNWFVIVVSFGSLLVATGKRSAEHLHLGDARARHRPVLSMYPASFLRSVRLLASSVTITAYCLWAFERSGAIRRGHHPIWFEISIAPVVLAVLYLELQFEQGHGGAPEDMALHDRVLQVLGLAWIVLFVVGIYT